MSSNFAGDYESRIIRKEVVRDASKKEQMSYLIELNAINPRVTYPKIEYWVKKGSFYPIKGKFYTGSGRLLKIAYYRKFKDILEGTRPSEVLIIDAIDSKKITKMQFSGHKEIEIPDFWFQRSWLPRHSGLQ